MLQVFLQWIPEDFKINWDNGYKDSLCDEGSLAMAVPLKFLAVGATATYIEGFDVSGVDLKKKVSQLALVLTVKLQSISN